MIIARYCQHGFKELTIEHHFGKVKAYTFYFIDTCIGLNEI